MVLAAFGTTAWGDGGRAGAGKENGWGKENGRDCDGLTSAVSSATDSVCRARAMNFIVNLAAAVGIGFSVYLYAAGEQAGVAGAVFFCLVVLVNESWAARRARRRAPTSAPPPAAPAEPLRDEIIQLRQRVDELERALGMTR